MWAASAVEFYVSWLVNELVCHLYIVLKSLVLSMYVIFGSLRAETLASYITFLLKDRLFKGHVPVTTTICFIPIFCLSIFTTRVRIIIHNEVIYIIIISIDIIISEFLSII